MGHSASAVTLNLALGTEQAHAFADRRAASSSFQAWRVGLGLGRSVLSVGVGPESLPLMTSRSTSPVKGLSRQVWRLGFGGLGVGLGVGGWGLWFGLMCVVTVLHLQMFTPRERGREREGQPRTPRGNTCIDRPILTSCPPRQKSRVERLKAKVEPLLT